MDVRSYLVAVLARWRWIVGAGLTGVVVAVLLAGSSAPVHRSTTTLYVGAAQITEVTDPAYAAQVTTEVLPSLVRLARSAAVLAPVIADLELPGSPSALAERTDVVGDADTSVLVISVDDGSPATATRIAAAVARSLTERATALYADTDGDTLVRLATVQEAAALPTAVAPDHRRAVAGGLLGGTVLAVLLAGAAELTRPRVRDARDVAATTDRPVLAELRRAGRRRTDAPDRRSAVDRLRWELADAPGPGVVLVGAPTEPADDLRAALAPAPAARPGGVVVVVRSGRTTRTDLHRALASATALGTPVRGVVVDDLPADPTGWRQRLRSATAPGAADRPAWRTTSGLTALLAVLLVGASRPLPGSLSTGLAVVLALSPVWLGAVARYRGARLLGGLTGVALLAGWVLAGRSSVDHDFALAEAVGTTAVVLTAAGTVGLLLWARTLVPTPALGAVYALGLLAVGVLTGAGAEEFYKFHVALPLTVAVLALLSARPRPGPTLAALAVLGVLDVLNDARSAFGFCVLAAALVLWQARTASRSPRERRLLTLALLPALAWGGYTAITELLVSGALGSEVAARTSTQIAQSGSLLLGGRPEWTATWALMRQDWWGFGLGTVPSAGDVAVARSGLATTRIPTVEGYLENYLLAGRFELHSIVADLWSNLGVAGLLLGAATAAVLLRSVLELIGLGRASGLACFLALTAFWDLAFSPLPANAPYTALTLGLLLAPAAGWAARPAPGTSAATSAPEPATERVPTPTGAPAPPPDRTT
ncbi:hypothetical protein [Modestobacter sp. VKM Ac-2985]|uniref:hypothetical protein n=1 Tax=Modestobacter sp. VKM Ac-2985 TaxID=3004139 RepID=UPI0022AB5188|nr:hypothetical protein [Modestobacter sp. VKM Ac-2985]MCZ2836439.1 hypothetical protein [Modestobacter sp. VKM Ac-2985]